MFATSACFSEIHSFANKFGLASDSPGTQLNLSCVAGARWFKWLEHEFTDRKVRGSNPTSASQLPLSRLGQPGSIPALVQPSGGMAVKHRRGVATERFVSQKDFGRLYNSLREMAQWLERGFTDRKVRGSNPTSAARLLLSRLGHLGIIQALVLLSRGLTAGHRKGVAAERLPL
ncbi:hypothetical protein CSKR_108001 [Clonorchis sinensis]|uniref:Uncharacterized protein n=1 Tax=Clonorchis sinensis TaxID=79923 RepID=A0A3R7G087_CLOSI|nr:hypothetical protein CSKR_108001 [Clonorchis sinensis]